MHGSKAAVQVGEQAFGATIAKVFPEATSGDLDPSVVVQLTQTMESAVRAGVDYNVDPSDNGED